LCAVETAVVADEIAAISLSILFVQLDAMCAIWPFRPSAVAGSHRAHTIGRTELAAAVTVVASLFGWKRRKMKEKNRSGCNIPPFECYLWPTATETLCTNSRLGFPSCRPTSWKWLLLLLIFTKKDPPSATDSTHRSASIDTRLTYIRQHMEISKVTACFSGRDASQIVGGF